ncbi:Alpha/Beta hydrolase protein [Apiospora arundinis]
MDSTSQSTAPIPRHSSSHSQTRHQSRRNNLSIDPSSLYAHPRGHSNAADSSNRVTVQPASPEVISSLITSLSVISKPATTLFDGPPTLPTPISPSDGSFGVEYGSFPSPPLGRVQEGISLDELAAAPPIIRTSKPPSGLSAVTAPKSPRSPHYDVSGGLRSLLRSSRPSSRGSEVSSHDDTRSIGNLSVERGQTPELHRRASQDSSWGRKGSRNYSSGMYMSSRERLRASSAERKRATIAAVGDSPGPLSPASIRPDPFLAELAIREEPTAYDTNSQGNLPVRSSSLDNYHNNFPSVIPQRDSSLRKSSSSNMRRTSQRRSKRESEVGINDSIPEHEEHYNRSRDDSAPAPIARRHQSYTDVEAESRRRRDEYLRPEMPSRSTTAGGRHPQEVNYTHAPHALSPEDNVEDGAPFPSVYSSRRRSARSTERRKSGRSTPEPRETLKTKRSSSALKRLSGNKTPEPGDRRATTPDPHVSYERPESADSVDEAVESYLCSPRLSQKIKHPQTGRVISFSEVGDAEGSAVFCCVGMGLTRYITAFYDELALTLKLRLITPDRPGVGDSEAYNDGTATPLSWPDDVYAICQALKITKFSILAHSAGAIYALATALRMPQHIRGRIHLLAPWIPPSQMNVFGTSQAMPPTNAIPTSQRILRALPTPFLKAANSSFMSATSSSITSSLPKTPRSKNKRKSAATTGTGRDKRDLTAGLEKENMPTDLYLPDGKTSPPLPTENMDQYRPNPEFNSPENAILEAAADALADKERQVNYDTRLTHAIWDLATTGANPAVDLLVCLERRHTVGFRYVDITRPVVIHHGSRDTRVPVENVKWLGKMMKRCEVRVLEGEGHGLMASASVMGTVLMEISKEWEDWLRVTGTSKRDGDKERGRSSRVGAR